MKRLKVAVKENKKDYLITLSIYMTIMLGTFLYIAQ
jgi:hypothetical protein